MSDNLNAGHWRLDPFKRIQVWVPNGPAGPDAFDVTEPEPKPEPPKDAPHRTAACVECGGPTTRRAARCWDCYIADRTAKTKSPPVTNPLRLHEPIDEAKVQSVLDGVPVKCSRPERLEVLARWNELGRTDRQLELLTGWNVPRDRKYIKSLIEMDTQHVA